MLLRFRSLYRSTGVRQSSLPDSRGETLRRRGQIHEYIVMHLPAVTRLSKRELSASVSSTQHNLKPDEPRPEGRRLFFDTHAVVRLLEKDGFTEQQAEVLVKVLMRVTNSYMDVFYSDMVTKVQQIAEQDRHLTQTNMKIDTEVANLKTMLESYKVDTIKYLAGSVFTCFTMILGFYRLWM